MTDSEATPTPDPSPTSDAGTPAPPEGAAPSETAPDAASAPSEPDASTATADAATAPAPRPPRAGAPDGHWWWGTGRRKASVARVRVRPGSGKFVVNNRSYDEFFVGERDRNDLVNVLEKTKMAHAVDVFAKVHGGGYTGQAGAIVLGLARALRQYDSTLEPILRDNNFLTRDPRKVERKKYGQPGARKRFQFSKR